MRSVIDCFSCWVATLSTQLPDIVEVEIKGHGTSVVNCMVKSTIVPLFIRFPKTNTVASLLSGVSNMQFLTTTTTQSAPLSLWNDACSSNFRILTSPLFGSKLIYSYRSFFYSENYSSFDPQALAATYNNMQSVIAASITPSSTVFLTSKNVFGWSSTSGLFEPTGLTNGFKSSFTDSSQTYDTLGMAVSNYCDHEALRIATLARDGHPSTRSNQDIKYINSNSMILWSRNPTSEPSFFYSSNAGVSFTEIKLSPLFGTLASSVLDVALMPVYSGAVALVRQTSGNVVMDKIVLVQQMLSTKDPIVKVSFLFPNQTTTSASMRRVQSFAHGGSGILVYGDNLSYR